MDPSSGGEMRKIDGTIILPQERHLILKEIMLHIKVIYFTALREKSKNSKSYTIKTQSLLIDFHQI